MENERAMEKVMESCGNLKAQKSMKPGVCV